MAVLDASIVNVALPSMSGSMGATIEQIFYKILHEPLDFSVLTRAGVPALTVERSGADTGDGDITLTHCHDDCCDV